MRAIGGYELTDSGLRSAAPREQLKAIVDAWETVQSVFHCDLEHAVDIVERAFSELGLKLYLPSEENGLFYPLTQEEADIPLMDLVCCAGADMPGIDWSNWRIPPREFERLIEYCQSIGRLEPASKAAASAPTPSAAPVEPRSVSSVPTESGHWKGFRHTRKLEALEAAGKRFWQHYDPEDISTMPTNDEVSGWLQKEWGLSKVTADVMASILRIEGLRTGPRK